MLVDTCDNNHALTEAPLFLLSFPGAHNNSPLAQQSHTSPHRAVTANWILSLMAFQRISENQGLKFLQIFHTLPQAYGQPPVAICLLSFDSPTCSFLCGPGFPDSAMQSIPPHDIFSWLYKLTGSKNCVLTAFYQKVILLSLSAPNGEISFFQYNQIYCVFNMVLKFPDLLTAKPAPVHLM